MCRMSFSRRAMRCIGGYHAQKHATSEAQSHVGGADKVEKTTHSTPEARVAQEMITMAIQQESESEFMVTAERIVNVTPRMSASELSALRAWELEKVTGDGKFGTSDWPGWRAVFMRLAH